MDLFDIITLLITLSAIFTYVNFRYLHFPSTIGLMFFALILSLGLIAINQFGLGIREVASDLVKRIDFNRLLLNGMLSFLLFAGALHVDINDLSEQKGVVLSLATGGVILSTFMVGGLAWVVLKILEFPVPLPYCLLFGALISPTDPIAVLGILKTTHAPKTLETQIAGESLFNDGMGVVVFILLLEISQGGPQASFTKVGLLFIEEVLGGLLIGLGVGFIAYKMLKSVDNYKTEILITLALAMGGYALANTLHTSGPLAIVVAGLLIGNHGRAFAMSSQTRERLDLFWELVDEILNAVLFVLIGLEVLVLKFQVEYLLAGMLMIPVALSSRLVSVSLPMTFVGKRKYLRRHTITALTWGGLRGGIAVALALSIPSSPYRAVILIMTYVVVVFSILVQGLTMKRILGGGHRKPNHPARRAAGHVPDPPGAG